MTRSCVAMGVLLTLLSSGPVLARGFGRGDGEIGFDVGYENFDSNTTDEAGATLGFRGGYAFTNHFELEGQAALSAAEVDSGEDIYLERVMVNAVFNLAPKNASVVPYILVGVGVVTMTFDSFFFEEEDSDLGWQGGFGSRFFFGRRDSVAFRLELSVLNEGTFGVTSTHTGLTGGFTWTL